MLDRLCSTRLFAFIRFSALIPQKAGSNGISDWCIKDAIRCFAATCFGSYSNFQNIILEIQVSNSSSPFMLMVRFITRKKTAINKFACFGSGL